MTVRSGGEDPGLCVAPRRGPRRRFRAAVLLASPAWRQWLPRAASSAGSGQKLEGVEGKPGVGRFLGILCLCVSSVPRSAPVSCRSGAPASNPNSARHAAACYMSNKIRQNKTNKNKLSASPLLPSLNSLETNSTKIKLVNLMQWLKYSGKSVF